MNYILPFVQNGRLKLTFIIAKVRDKTETKSDELLIPRLYTLVGAKGALSFSCPTRKSCKNHAVHLENPSLVLQPLTWLTFQL